MKIRSRESLIKVLESVNLKAVGWADHAAAAWAVLALQGKVKTIPIIGDGKISSPHIAELVEQAKHYLRMEAQ